MTHAALGIKLKTVLEYDYIIAIDKTDEKTGERIFIGIKPNGDVEIKGADVTIAARIFWEALAEEIKRRPLTP